MAASTRSAASLWTAAWLLFLSAVLALLPAGCGGGTPEHREAAELYIKFLTEPQQRKALEFGFRPADPKIALAAPIDTAHGVDPRKPHMTLEALVFDISGRTRGEKMTQAKAGAAELVKLQGDDDRLLLCVFKMRTPNCRPTRLPA